VGQTLNERVGPLDPPAYAGRTDFITPIAKRIQTEVCITGKKKASPRRKAFLTVSSLFFLWSFATPRNRFDLVCNRSTRQCWISSLNNDRITSDLRFWA
jgi:hypothetical protein